MKLISIFLMICVLNGCTEKVKTKEASNLIDSHSKSFRDNFFQFLERNKFDSAFNELVKGNDNFSLTDSMTQDLLLKFNQIGQTSGDFVNYRLIRSKYLGDDLGIYVYFVKFNRKFYRFIFTFYNNEQSVQLFKFSFDNNADTELEESLRLFIDS